MNTTYAPPPTEVEIMSPADPLAEIAVFSDGQPWDEDRAIRAIQHELEHILVSANRIGRVLIHARAHLGHGAFQEWVGARLPFSYQTANRYMQIAAFFAAHPKLAEPLAAGRLKNVLLLTSLPAEVEDALAEDGGLAQIPAEELGRMPYSQLKKLTETLERQVSHERDRVDQLEKTLAQRNETIARATTRRVADGDDLSKRTMEAVLDLRQGVGKLMERLGFELDLAAQRYDELTPEAQAEVAGLMAWIETWTRVERIRHELLRGADTPAYLLQEALEEPRPAASRFPIPPDRELPVFGS